MKQTQQDLAPHLRSIPISAAAATFNCLRRVAKSVFLNYGFAFWLIKKVQPAADTVSVSASAGEDHYGDILDQHLRIPALCETAPRGN